MADVSNAPRMNAPKAHKNVGAGFTPARLREGIKPSPTVSCAEATLVSLMSVGESIDFGRERNEHAANL